MKQVKKVETKEKIENAAIALFREKGFDRTTVQEITSAAHVAKGTFLTTFRQKIPSCTPLQKND